MAWAGWANQSCSQYSFKYQYKYQYLSLKYQYQYQYPSLKYKYRYQYFSSKYQYQYKYLKMVLKFRSSTSTSTKYYNPAVQRCTGISCNACTVNIPFCSTHKASILIYTREHRTDTTDSCASLDSATIVDAEAVYSVLL